MSGPLKQELISEIKHFEDFFGKMGFKRIEGAVYGALVLAASPLSSEQLSEYLQISQSAISMATKKLADFGAIEVSDCREKRVKQYSAKNDALAVVATVFRKREQHSIEEFKKMLQRVRDYSESDPANPLKNRFESMLYTCELAEAIMNMVIAIAQIDQQKRSGHLAKKLPQIIEILSSGVEPLTALTQTVKNNFTEKFKSGFGKITGDNDET